MRGLLRRLPHFKGKFRLLKLLYRRKLQIRKDIVVEGKFGLRYLLPNLKENIAFEIFADGIYEPETSQLIAEKMPENGILLDVGANIGSIAIPVCKLRPDVKAVCLEASPRVYKYLEKNTRLNNIENCLLVNYIISDKNEEEIGFFSPMELFGKGSVSPNFTSVAEKVRAITIDSLIEQLNLSQIHFIKIDIEGYEYYAFRGAENLLRSSNAPDILFEFLDLAESFVEGIRPGDAQKLLISYGYKLYSIEAKGKFAYLPDPMVKGNGMFFASKNSQC